jgi:hypothetical protein
MDLVGSRLIAYLGGAFGYVYALDSDLLGALLVAAVLTLSLSISRLALTALHHRRLSVRRRPV